MGRKDSNKPRGRMSSYAFFVQTCREEHKKKHPGESVVFTEFTKKCAEKWKKMEPSDKKRFESMADKDKARYENEMKTYQPPKGEKTKKKRKSKDPNAPKRALSAFFFFCGEERAKVKEDQPGLSVSEVAKALGKRWEVCKDKSKYEKMAKKDKERYEVEITAYRSKDKPGASPAKKPKPAVEEVEDDDDEEEEEEEEEEEDDDEDED